MLDLLNHARRGCESHGICLQPHVTTNGMHNDAAAQEVMRWPGMQVSISHDGLPEVHDRHRHDANGDVTSATVLDTIEDLLNTGQDLSIVMVVRPDNVETLPSGIEFLRRRGLRHFVPSLDLWTNWTKGDLHTLENSLMRCSETWHAGLPNCSVSWFDEKMAHLAGLDAGPTARCGFGDGEIAVSPAGSLYPCERLIGEDQPANPMRLPGHALEGNDFRPLPAPTRNVEGCSACAIQSCCATTCRCSNYIRTGDIGRPDRLLCLLDRVCYRETARIMQKWQYSQSKSPDQPQDRVDA